MTEIKPQRININVPTAELTPSFLGMPWFDEANSILRVDLVGNGVEADFAAALPQHTATGEHGPKVTITQTSADNALEVTQNFAAAAVTIAAGSTGSGNALSISSASNTARLLNITMNGNADVFHITNNGTGASFVVNTNAFVISNAGDIGIGTSGPSDKLTISGGNVLLDNTQAYKFEDNAGSDFNALSCTAANNVQLVTPSSGGALQLIANHAGGTIQFLPGATERMRLNASGDLGIGELNPNAKLDVVQTNNAIGVEITQSGDEQGVQIVQSGAGTAIGISKTHTGSDVAVNIANSGTGTGVQVTQSGNAAAVTIQNDGVGNDIRGTDTTWNVDNSGNATFNTVTTATTNQSIFTLSWAAEAGAKSTGVIGFTPHYAIVIFAGHTTAQGSNVPASGIGFTTGVGASVSIANVNNVSASSNKTSSADSNAVGGMPQAGLGFRTNHSDGVGEEIDVTAFSSTAITLTPTGSITGTAFLLVIG